MGILTYIYLQVTQPTSASGRLENKARYSKVTSKSLDVCAYPTHESGLG